MRAIPWGRIGVTCLALGFLLWRLPTGALRVAFQNIDSRQLLPALCCVLGMLAVRAYKWHQMLSEGGVVVHPRESIRSLLGGFVLGLIIPGRLGELGRCLFSAESHRVRVTLLNILDRALDMWALLTLAVPGLFLLVPRPAAIFGLGVWLAILPVVMGLPTLISTLAVAPRWPEVVRTRAAAAAPILARIRTRRYAVLSVCSTSLDMLLFFFLLRAFHPVEFATALATFPLIVMAGGLPVSLSGLGLREGVAALLLTRFAIPPGVAVDVALLLFAFSALIPALLGGVWLLVDRRAARPSWSGDLGTLAGPSLKSPPAPVA